MILFPVGESKTQKTFAPWATLLFVLLSAAAFFWVHYDLQQRSAQSQAEASEALKAAIDRQVAEGRLKADMLLRYQTESDLLDNPGLATFFDPEVRQAWYSLQHPEPLLRQIQHRYPEGLWLIITPHHWLVLLAGLMTLWLCGYLLEHVYDHQVVLGLLLVLTFSWILLARLIPAAYVPTPVLSWMFAVQAFALIATLVAPTANIQLALRGWLIKPLDSDWDVPMWAIPLGFAGVSVGITYLDSPYQADLSWLPGLTLVGTVLALGLILAMMPVRAVLETETPAKRVERILAEAQIKIERGDVDAGQEQLCALAREDLPWKLLRPVADAVWRQDLRELAEQCYRSMLRQTQTQNEDAGFIATLEEILFRRIAVDPKYVLRGFDLIIAKSQLPQARKLLPYLLDNHTVASQDQLPRIEAMVKMVLAFHEPDKYLLLDLQTWYENNQPASPILSQINHHFLGQATESRLEDPFSRNVRIHRLVDVDLLEIHSDRVLIQIPGQQPHHVPCSAFVALFGCYQKGSDRGYRGCLVIQSKRKVLACCFTPEHVKVEEQGNQLTFESAWTRLQLLVPEDLPCIDLVDFEEIPADKFHDKLEAFINPEAPHDLQ